MLNRHHEKAVDIHASDKYIFTQEWYQFPEIILNDISENDWEMILQAKEAVNKAIESARSQKLINANLSANVAVFAQDTTYQALAKLKDELRFVFITSQASLHPFSEKSATALSNDEGNLAVSVQLATGEKCVRCWHIVSNIGTHTAHPQLCERCVSNLPEGQGEIRDFA